MYKYRLIEILKDLIEIDTTNPPGNERGIVLYVQSLLSEAKTLEVVHDDFRSSLVVHIGPYDDSRPTITFIGHTDTVPFSLENWTYPPLEATQVSGRIYGRGTSDMKSGLACMICLGEHFLEFPNELAVNLRLVFTADEESDGIGMVGVLKEGVIKPDDFLIVPEPTDLAVAFVEKGALWIRLKAFGKASHGSAPEMGQNAINAIFTVTDRLQQMVVANNEFVGATTVSLNCIQGGKKVNVVPDYAEAEIDIRYPPEISSEKILRAIDLCIAETQTQGLTLEYEVINLRSALANTQKRFKASINGAMRALDLDYREIGVRYFTDLSSFDQLPNEFAIIGPGVLDQAHVEDEYVETELLEKAYLLYKYLLTEGVAE